MKILVIGLGSMGKRRIRNLQANKITNIHGFDQREDRRKEAAQLYGIPVHGAFEAAIKEKFDALIISVPPDKHDIYISEAIKLGRYGMGFELNHNYFFDGVAYCKAAESAVKTPTLFDLINEAS